MAHNKQKKTMLHELLKQNQEPFHLKAHISQKRSLLKKKTISNILCRHACFFNLHGSSDVAKSPFAKHLSPAPCCRSPNGAVFLQVPSKTASLLLEAALRIQKHQKPKHRSGPGDGLGFFGSFLKKIKGKSRKRVTAERDFKKRSERRVVGNGADWSKSNREEEEEEEEDGFFNCCGSHDDVDFPVPRFCVSPFVFSFRRSPLSSGRFTPEFSSPVGSPSSHAPSQENENSIKNIEGAKDEEKEQCSPVSVLDTPFEEEEEDDHEEEEEEEAEDDDYNLESSYENVQRAKQQLLQRLRRFEKLAELDPLELEGKLLEVSSDEECELVVSEDYYKEKPLKSKKFNKSRKISPELNLVIIEKCQSTGDKEVEFETIDAMIELDFKMEVGNSWKNVSGEIEEVGVEVEVLIFDVLLQELYDGMYLY